MSKIIAAVLSFVISLHATFDTSTTAVVSWQQPPGVALTCLRIYHPGEATPAAICYNNLPAGETIVRLPGSLVHPAYRPQVGTRLVLAFGMDDVGTTTLGEVPSVYTTYLPHMTNAPPQAERVYVPVLFR